MENVRLESVSFGQTTGDERSRTDRSQDGDEADDVALLSRADAMLRSESDEARQSPS
ncbi:hypothetical protein KIN20_003948 [Parelaphostrongylus tenuis]|uniref:Uncharacterized protein n=1 Tax=Parelaphostrongylus tenuis TaxID=148309 RepID=A0AAD5MGC3_PARTN|nr:hypothetical protein KIN20_003948 [Parelaphostrongylus tenuis]